MFAIKYRNDYLFLLRMVVNILKMVIDNPKSISVISQYCHIHELQMFELICHLVNQSGSLERSILPRIFRREISWRIGEM